MEKICRKCSEVKGASEFSIDRAAKDGLKRWCRACIKVYNDANRDAIAERGRQYRQKNPDKVKQANKEKYQRNIEERKVYRKRQYAQNRDAAIEAAMEWSRANPEKRAAIRKRWLLANPELMREIHRAWVKRNPEAVRAKDHRRRAREAGGSFTKNDVLSLFAKQKGLCAVCRCQLTRYEIDHIFPLARGGRNDKNNIQLLCMPCNRSKGASEPTSFMQSRGYLL